MLVGYRWYDAKHLTPLFPFGFGLSYTTFALRNLVAAPARGANLVKVSFDVANTGSRPGAEVAQMYVADPRNTGEPPRQLKGFDKVALNPGGRRHVALELNFRSFAHWSVRAHRWKVTAGCYGIWVGDSSRNLPLAATVAVERARCHGASVHISSAMLGIARTAR
jgi:beta-glucosidase